jgi:hypothetical protein
MVLIGLVGFDLHHETPYSVAEEFSIRDLFLLTPVPIQILRQILIYIPLTPQSHNRAYHLPLMADKLDAGDPGMEELEQQFQEVRCPF